MSECSEGLSRSSRREEEEVLVGNNSCREVVANLPSCLATSRDNVVGNNNHLAHRRLSLPVSFDLRFVFLGHRSERSKIKAQVFNLARLLRGTEAPPGDREVFHHFCRTLCQENKRDL